MSDSVILVDGVSKGYMLYDQPQDRLKQMLFGRFGRRYGRAFWALQGISFEVRRGESVGIIGRNGSGKSTLLQIIAGTLAPTTGQVRVAGRVAALLELGSGFNPEFTGRENVFMNGAILGISHEEMVQRYGEIEAFADIGAFIDQPVKLYSSGMMLRLSFAVQVVVRKDVLIVDEALAVGDEAFQRKCMRRLEEFQGEGGTILLVSHSAQAIIRQCHRCLFLHKGELLMDGPSKFVTDMYQRFVYSSGQQQRVMVDELRRVREAPVGQGAVSAQVPVVAPRAVLFDEGMPVPDELVYGGEQAEVFDCGMFDGWGRPVNVLYVGAEYVWRYCVRFYEAVRDVKFGMMFKTIDGLELSSINTVFDDAQQVEVEAGMVLRVSFRVRMNLGPGTYFLNSGVMGEAETGSGYLHRRIDVAAVRVIAPDGRLIQGLAYMEPQVDVQVVDG